MPTHPMPPQNPEQARWFADEVQPHETDLRVYLRRQFPSLNNIDDMVQESFVQLVRAHEARPIDCVRAYLFTIAGNTAKALLRRPKIFAANPLTDSTVLRIVEDDADVAEQVCTREETAILLEAIESLPGRCREVFILRKLRRVSQKEIASQLGISEQTVQVQVARGARKCGEFLRHRGVIHRFAAGPSAASAHD